jgi:hypothetical protein
VVTLGVIYPTSFLLGIWKSAESGDLSTPGAYIGGGELAGGLSYEIYERRFPKSYRMDLSADFGALCVLEVRDGPKPLSASHGAGTLIHVTLEKPLPGQASSRISIDLSEAERARCAGVVTDGQLFAGGAASSRNNYASGAPAPAQTASTGLAQSGPAMGM